MNHLEFDWGKEFDTFLRSLNPKDRAKLVAVINKIEEQGLETAKQLQ